MEAQTTGVRDLGYETLTIIDRSLHLDPSLKRSMRNPIFRSS